MQTSASRNSQTVIGWLCIMPYFIGLIFLSYYGGAKLESAIIFILMGLFSLFAAGKAYQAGVRPFKWWDGQFNKQDLKFIGIGYGALLGIVLGITTAFGGGSVAILVALTGGGVMLFFSLNKGQTILVPLIVHGLYNFSALALANASIVPLSSFAFYVPNFTLDGIRPADLATQFILQFGFVSFGEECLKVSLALGVYIFSRNKNLGFAISIGMWTLLHSILSYRIHLPF